MHIEGTLIRNENGKRTERETGLYSKGWKGLSYGTTIVLQCGFQQLSLYRKAEGSTGQDV